jgi:hypothetical protein
MVANSSSIMNPAIDAAPAVRSNTRLLGLLGMVFSPFFLVMITSDTDGQGNLVRVGAFAGLLFTIGWFCNVLGLLQLRATGKRLPGKILLGVELVGVTLAAIFQVFEFTGFGEGTIFFTITDIAWPLSMVTLLIIGITIAIIGGLRGAARFVPILAPIWLPLNIVVTMTVGRDAALIVSGIVATLGWVLTGYVIFQGGGFTKRA